MRPSIAWGMLVWCGLATDNRQPCSAAVCCLPQHTAAFPTPPLALMRLILPAGKLAGLDTVRLIREPVAAALAYGLDLEEEQVADGCRAVDRSQWGWCGVVCAVMLGHYTPGVTSWAS